MAVKPRVLATFWVTSVTCEPVSQKIRAVAPPLVETHWATSCTSHPGSSVGVGSSCGLGVRTRESFSGPFLAFFSSTCRSW